MIVALILIVLAALYRLVPTTELALANFSPVMAIAFCGAVYFRNRWMWLVPFAAVGLSDLYINHFYATQYGFTWPLSGTIARTACFAAALFIGLWVSQRKSWLNLLNGALLGAILFYIVTNTQSWASDAFYAKTFAGWWQALTVGHPEYPPTVYFFRNTLFGDLMFTGLFAGIMECIAKRKGEPSLLDNDETEESTDEKPGEVEAKD
ncbi:DUF6580 family putative transport protein [Oleiharenicola lentus]|uniref:DUF6580 family putative transport protein n=1 Tax=Oleiharenicola lentus TaxID=2508720 RepID=UPI003F680251